MSEDAVAGVEWVLLADLQSPKFNGEPTIKVRHMWWLIDPARGIPFTVTARDARHATPPWHYTKTEAERHLDRAADLPGTVTVQRLASVYLPVDIDGTLNPNHEGISKP